MKTHDLADAMEALARVLRNAPNMTLNDLAVHERSEPFPDASSIPVALSTLVSLAKFDKSQWENFIKEFNLRIEVRPRDASRDVIGKILRALEQNPEARNRLVHRAQDNRSRTSPELMKALQLLLRS